MNRCSIGLASGRMAMLRRANRRLREEICERLRAEEALARSQARLNEAQRISQVGGFERDWLSGMRYWSDELYHILGYASGEVLPTFQLFLSHILPEDRKRFCTVLAEAKAGRRPLETELRFQPRGGGVRHARITAHMVFAGGRATRTYGVVQDITERKFAEERQALDAARLEILVQLGRLRRAELQEVSTFVLEAALSLSASPAGFLALVGEESGALEVVAFSNGAGTPCAMAGPEQHVPIPLGGLWHLAIREQGPLLINDYEQPLSGKAGLPPGHPPIHRLLVAPVMGEAGVGALLAVANKKEPYNLTDVNQLTLLGEGFWRVLAERREQQDLIAARDAAQSATLAKSEFLANMSHEIRTPLNAMLGMLQLLQAMPLVDKQRLYVTTAISSGHNLLTLLDDILDISRIEAGRLQLNCEVFELAELVASVVELFELQARQKRLGLFAEIRPGLPRRLKGDPARLRQVLFNLVGNAVKFTDEGEVRIWVAPALGPVRPGEVGLLLGVADTGVGMAPEVLSRIFEPFSQGDSSSTRRHQGTGLGLAIVKRLAELMDARVDVASTPDKGSLFTLQLRLQLPDGEEVADAGQPAQREVVADRLAGAAPRPAPRRAGQACGALRILLAEDNPVNRLYVQELLASLGHAVRAVGDGKEVLEALERDAYDLVLMDVQMPDMDGLEATRRIRATTWGGIDPHVPIVAMTAHAMRGDRERFLAAGMDDYLPKPFEQQDLERILDRLRLC